jgi:LCP family protein required for cell wall assembly
MKLRQEDKKKILRCTAIVLVVICILTAGLLLLDLWEKRQGTGSVPEKEVNTLKYNGNEYVFNENVDTFLVMGLDKFEGDIKSDAYTNDRQADFLMLFVFDNASKKCTALHINRDTMADVNKLDVTGFKVVGTINQQIALAHIYGDGDKTSCRNTADAVSKLLKNVKIDHYISVTMDTVPVFNDLVGGVEVTVTEDFSGLDDTLVKGEKVTLMGEHALNYVRTRKGLEDSSNSTRMERQKQYLEALYNKTMQCIESDDEFVVNASLAISDYIVSDRSVTQLQEIMEKASSYEFAGIMSLEGESRMGEKFIEFYPDEEFLMKTVVDLFFTEKENN